MIADKILPSFYFLEIRGSAVESIFAGDYGIEEIHIESKDFNTDLDATAALKNALNFVTSAPHLDTSSATEKIDFNPDFFPSLAKIEVTEEQQIAYQALLDEAANQSSADKDVIVLTKLFDSMGDYVQSRWRVDAPTFSVVGRIAIDPDLYIAEKAQEHFTEKYATTPQPQQIAFH
jgi:hypothetical protein